MKTTGITRQIDSFGRFVVPKELRSNLGIEDNDFIEIFTEDDKIILKKYAPGCMFCGKGGKLYYFKGKMICESCKEEIAAQK